MSLGLCCQFLQAKTKKSGKIEYVNSLDERTLQYGLFQKGKYSNDQIYQTYLSNIKNLKANIINVSSIGFKSFRVSSNLFPLYDKADPSLMDNDDVRNILKEIGDIVKSNNVRVSSHPSQWCVIASEKDSVIENAIANLKHHAWVFDMMGLDQTRYYSINIHGAPKDQYSKLINSINSLPNNVKNRLTLENDERSYSVKKLYDIYRETGVAICYDSHHHSFNPDGLSGEEAMLMAMETWGAVKPNTHLSNSEPEFINCGSFTEKRKHSNYYHTIPQYQLEANNSGKIDIDMECKMKNIAILKAVEDFGLVL
jgi:UV DNA damage endonuclease